MKKVCILYFFVLFFGINISAQTKEFRFEKDGFEWFLIKQNGKYGALSFNGKQLLPTTFDAIGYTLTMGNRGLGFEVEQNGFWGFYNVDGECIIPVDRKYIVLGKRQPDKDQHGIGTHYYFKKSDGRRGFCDCKGNEVIVLDNKAIDRFNFIEPHYNLGYFYYSGINDDVYGWENAIINGDGDMIFTHIGDFLDIDEEKKKFYYEDDDTEKIKYIGSVSKVKTTYNPFSGNGTDDIGQIWAKMGFTPFGGKAEKRIDENDGKEKYFLEKDGQKGIRDLQGKWIVPLCKDYKLLSVGGSRYYIVTDDKSRVGLISLNGDRIINIEYDAIEETGKRYVKVRHNSVYGVLSLDGKEIISTSRGYTYIGDYDSNKGTFSFTKKGFTGVCDAQGREISTTRLAPTTDDIKANGGYASAVEMKNGSTKYYKVSKGGRYGLTDSEGREIVPCEMEALESAGTGYLKYKINGFWGLMNYTGKILIGTERGYTSIGNFVTFTKRFPYTMAGYKGECDINGRQISKIKVESPKQNTSVASSSSSSSGSSSSNNNSGNKTTTVVVEHKHDPVPMQVWKQCTGCYGSGMCQSGCGGSGWFTGYSGNSTRCIGCGGSGKCQFCAGQGGHYEVEYR